jgi:hypothetical protein
VEQDNDIFFFGNGGAARRKNLEMMITEPSRSAKFKFLVSGRDMDLDLGKALVIPPMTFTSWRNYCCRSRINLNVVRELHALVKATSTSRPFELAAMGCCIVSSPYDGLEKWFEIGKEILVAKSASECKDLYAALLEDTEVRRRFGTRARDRLKKEHTSVHRAMQIAQLVTSITQ